MIPLIKNEEWISFGENMFIDHRCWETYSRNSLSMLIQFTNLCKNWYIKPNNKGVYSDLRRYIKIRDLIFKRNKLIIYRGIRK